MKTINDVAKLAKVSKGTISRYLNGTLKLKEETKQRIETAIAETNYVPSKIAASIKTKNSNTIALVIPSTSNLTFAEIAEAINDTIAPMGYSMVIYTTNDKLELEKQATNKIRENRLDGAIFITEPNGDKDMSHIDLLEESGIKTLMINRFYEPNKYSNISVDYYKGVKEVVKYLTKMDYRKIGLILGWEHQYQSDIYKKGYIDIMKEMGLDTDEKLMKYCNYNEEETKEVVNELIKIGADAFFTISEKSAFIALDIVEQQNIEIPDKMAIVGSGNTEFSRLIKMTSLDGKGELIGKKAAQMLLDKMKGNEEDTFQLIKTDLVVRNTTIKK
ncbi:MAG: LacI family DNA-binding transcriptional regulator [Clostridia bacterium]